MIPTIKWEKNCVHIIDQRKLPEKQEWLMCVTLQDVTTAIREMAIRGAPAIGIAAAMGLALGAQSIDTTDYGTFRARFLEMAQRLKRTRPTAVNLGWAVERMIAVVEGMANKKGEEIREALRKESEKILTVQR